MGNHKRVVALLVVAVAVFSVLIALLMNRSDGSERSRQLKEQAVVGKPVSLTQDVCGPGCVFLPMIAANAGPLRQAGPMAPEALITVVAQTSHVCQADAAVPVAGARITVVTDHGSRVNVTDAAGFALFEPADEPAVVQIEWPVGLLPCPNSRPMVELPSGAGEVKFMASAAAYP
jgi:hypothetical protein